MAKRTKKKQEDTSFNVWSCCDNSFTHEEVMKHLEEVHGLQRPLKGSREMIQHIDGREYFQSDYKWTIGELVLYQSVRSVRDEDDMMRYV